MEKSTIEIKMIDQEIDAIIELRFSTENIKLFSEFQDKLIELFELFDEESEKGVVKND